MQYLTGAVRDSFPIRLGFMMQPGMGNRPDLSTRVWAADNGCFTTKGTFDEARWVRWLLAMRPHASTCLFATAPDVVGDAQATLVRSVPWLRRLRAMGYRPAFVLQDGIEDSQVPWDLCDAVFIGGSTEFKLSDVARRVTAEAKARGKHVHMGRVNSLRRLRIAESFGCDSADGTYLAFGPDRNLPTLLGWLDELERTPMAVAA